ncbi:MAG: tryptophan--tRNA ligase [Oscillospiraceae bacterium]|nr:tryptophan--tRNA ligase [Oscillospiraceae bacterium]
MEEIKVAPEAPKPEKKKTILSCIQPSGIPTLGNYLGALKNWKLLADEFDSAFAVADLHAITVRQDPQKLRKQIMEVFALLLAIGLDPEKSIIFIQSQVPAHSQLAWILNCYTQFGEMSRMTQFKDKSQSHADNVNVGLFAYPVLMAADILLYQADLVPVGADQKQHLEIARDIGNRFNGIYGKTFTIPEPYIGKSGARVMSLQDPMKKMSKSDPNPKSFVSVFDQPETIMKKIRSAVTDSEGGVYYGEGKDGINNLMGIYSCCTGLDYEQIAADFSGKGYGDFKNAVGEAVVEELRPVRERYEMFMKDQAYLKEMAAKGAESASRIANRTLTKVMKKCGFVLP